MRRSLPLLLATACSLTLASDAGAREFGFASPLHLVAGRTPDRVVATRLAGDRRADLVVSNLGRPYLTVLRGRGRGRFHGPERYPVENGFAIAAGDLDGDRGPDVVSASGEGLTVLRGTARGRLAKSATYPRLSGSSLTIADLNGDRRGDVMATDGLNLETALAGPGGRLVRQPVVALDGAGELAAADFNADGRIDLAVALGDNGTDRVMGGVSVLLGRGDGTFGEPIGHPGTEGSVLAAADFDGDGHVDVAGSGDASLAWIRLGRGDGTLGPEQSRGRGYGSGTLAAADMDDDRRPDLVAPRTSDVAVLHGRGDGSFSQTNHPTRAEELTWVAVARMGGDGRRDIAVVAGAPERVAVLRSR